VTGDAPECAAATLTPGATNTVASAACPRHTCPTALVHIPIHASHNLPPPTHTHLLPAQVHPEVPFVDSSPSNGLEASTPYVKRWGDSSDARFGDVHYYNYRDDCQDHVRGRGGWCCTAVCCAELHCTVLSCAELWCAVLLNLRVVHACMLMLPAACRSCSRPAFRCPALAAATTPWLQLCQMPTCPPALTHPPPQAIYPRAKFVSEFGFQSFPSWSVIKGVTTPEDWSADSAMTDHRWAGCKPCARLAGSSRSTACTSALRGMSAACQQPRPKPAHASMAITFDCKACWATIGLSSRLAPWAACTRCPLAAPAVASGRPSHWPHCHCTPPPAQAAPPQRQPRAQSAAGEALQAARHMERPLARRPAGAVPGLAVPQPGAADDVLQRRAGHVAQAQVRCGFAVQHSAPLWRLHRQVHVIQADDAGAWRSSLRVTDT
jgi:hypothetical protein